MLPTQNVCPLASIILLNWNGLADTLECLGSLRKIDYPNFSTIVVDNGSEGYDAEVIREKFGDFAVVVKEARNLGFTGGCNVGLQWALDSGAKYVLLLNNDTVVQPSFLAEMVSTAEGDERVGVVGPKIMCYEAPSKILCAGAKVNLFTGATVFNGADEVDCGRYDRACEVDFVSGAALLIKAETVKRIGLLYNPYFAYFEETDWCLKAKKAGFKVVYEPKARVWHKTHKGETELAVFYMTGNRFIFLKRNSSGFQFAFFSLYFLLTDFILKLRFKLFPNGRFLVAYFKGVWSDLSSLASYD